MQTITIIHFQTNISTKGRTWRMKVLIPFMLSMYAIPYS